MILFHELNIGTGNSGGGVRPCPRCLRSASTGQAAATEPIRLQALAPRIEELAAAGASVMLRGFEPFQHPDLVGIIQTLAMATGEVPLAVGTTENSAASVTTNSTPTTKIRRIGMRTDGAALANLRDAQGCIDNGVRVFEIPFLPREMDALSQTAPLEASFAGIRGIRSASAALGVAVFICADITICMHTAKYFTTTVQAVIAAGVDAIRLSCGGGCDRGHNESSNEPTDPAELLGGKTVLNQAHSLATQNSLAFFGDGCEDYLGGASLYEVINETAGTAGEKR